MTRREDRLAADVGARIEGCPDAEQLQGFQEGSLSGADRRRVSEHVEGCAACSEAMAWIDRGAAEEEADLGQEVPADVEARVERLFGAMGERQGSRRWGELAAAAVIVALIAVGFWQFRGKPAPEEPVYREGEAGTVRSLLTGDSLPRDGFLLQWSAGGEISHYDLWISTEALDPIAEVKGLVEPEHTVDAFLLEGIDTGARLIWQVEAVRPGGERVRSDTFVVVVE